MRRKNKKRRLNMSITLEIKKQGGGMKMHIGEPGDERGIFVKKGDKKPKDMTIPKKGKAKKKK